MSKSEVRIIWVILLRSIIASVITSLRSLLRFGHYFASVPSLGGDIFGVGSREFQKFRGRPRAGRVVAIQANNYLPASLCSGALENL